MNWCELIEPGTGWPLVGNEGIKQYMLMIDGDSFPHSLLRASQGIEETSMTSMSRLLGLLLKSIAAPHEATHRQHRTTSALKKIALAVGPKSYPLLVEGRIM